MTSASTTASRSQLGTARGDANDSASGTSAAKADASLEAPDIIIEPYRDETQLALIQTLVDNDLSEPYSIFTYRYFITQWPHLCHLAMEQSSATSDKNNDNNDNTRCCIGVIVCKQETSRHGVNTGYIAMLAVRRDRRNHGLGSALVSAAIDAMQQAACQQVTLEAEVSNRAALKLYDNLGFIRDKRLEKYYLNGNDAFRLKLRLRSLSPSHYIRY